MRAFLSEFDNHLQLMKNNGLMRSQSTQFELVARLKGKCHPAVTAFVQALLDSELHEEDIAWWREQLIKNREKSSSSSSFNYVSGGNDKGGGKGAKKTGSYSKGKTGTIGKKGEKGKGKGPPADSCEFVKEAKNKGNDFFKIQIRA
eukprot:SAG11_NODE_641_length_8008_cov_2.916171_1_plen_146_part_00